MDFETSPAKWDSTAAFDTSCPRGTTPNMSSAIINFPNWTPPALSSLNFGSNCTHTRAFLQSWFDLSAYEDINTIPGNKFNVTFWVPQTLQAQATEAYFREALPPDLQVVALYGEILEWERVLRDNYTNTLTEFLGLVDALNLTGAALHSELDSLDLTYYEHVIHAPSRACREKVCSLGFDWDQLGDVNGPGVRTPQYLIHSSNLTLATDMAS